LILVNEDRGASAFCRAGNRAARRIGRRVSMPINGIASLNWGVGDVAETARYFRDMGVPLLEQRPDLARFRFEEGSTLVVRHRDDAALPASDMVGDGVREIIWGVDNEDCLKALVADLSRDHELRVDDDGVHHFLTSFGLALGLKLFRKTPVVSAPPPLNSPGNINRLNLTRKWRKRATPKTISHVGHAVPDPDAMLDFYRRRLRFRVTDVQPGMAIYLRAPGATDHHNTAVVDSRAPSLEAWTGGKLVFNHANFIFEDIDELMIAKAQMERTGWPKSPWGLGRHGIAGSAFIYIPCPGGGEVEMCADMDHVDDTWVPRVMSIPAGLFMFVHDRPSYVPEPQGEWEIGYCDPDTVTFKHAPEAWR